MPIQRNRAFTVVEYLVIITIIGFLVLLAMPFFQTVGDQDDAVAFAQDMSEFTEAVRFYNTAEGAYPVILSPTQMPEGVAEYVPAVWKDGTYSWSYVDSPDYTYLFFYDLNFTAEQIVQVDRITDDGNIATGDLRSAFNHDGAIYFFKVDLPMLADQE